MQDLVGDFEKKAIRAQVDRILRDLGNPEPPLKLADVRKLLSLDLGYYSSADPGLVSELTHRFRLLARKTLPDLHQHLATALATSRLCAFWLPESSRILIDNEVPEPKHRWIEAHEISHSVTEWHRQFLFGDNSQTLDPACHATLEAEANYGAGRLLFLQDQFSSDARDLSVSFKSIIQLSKRYENSILSTFWRMIEDRDPQQPVVGIVSIHPQHPTVGKHNGSNPWRYFVRSTAFRLRFGNVTPDALYAAVAGSATERKNGPVASLEWPIDDLAGNRWQFEVHSFSTGHALLTIAVPQSLRSILVGGAAYSRSA
jgi:hypothetical protein